MISSSNLTLPPSIPGFEVRLLFDPDPTILLTEVWLNAILLISELAHGRFGGWDQSVPPQMTMTFSHFRSVLRIRPWPPGTSELHVKHAVRAIFEAGVALAAKPIIEQGYQPRLHAGLFLQNRQIGLLQWALKPRSVDTEGNSTMGVLDVGNSTGVLQLEAANSPRALPLVHGDGPASVNAENGTIVDPGDPRFTITYVVTGGNVDARNMFSVFLDALATVAPNDVDATGAYVNAVGVSGDLALNMHGTGAPDVLSWGWLVQALTLIFEEIMWNHRLFKEMDWKLLFSEREIASGFIFNISSGGH